MTIRQTLAAALAATAIAAPAASAMPAPPDMQASRAQAIAQQRQKQDLRGEAAKDAALNANKAKAVNAPGATASDSQSKVARVAPVAPGQPTWPVNPQPIAPPAHHVSATTSDDGVDWVTIGIGVGITLLLVGGIVALTNRSRTLPRTRVST